MPEFKIGEIPSTIRRKYTEEDYRRIEIWMERLIDPSQITGLDAGRAHLVSLTKAHGALKLIRRGGFDKMLFGAFAGHRVSEAKPLRPGRVADVSRWRERREAQLVRIWRSRRLLDELRAFQLPAPRRPMEELIARKYGRKPSSISKDLETLRSLGFLERVRENYVLTKAGVSGLRGWEW